MGVSFCWALGSFRELLRLFLKVVSVQTALVFIAFLGEVVDGFLVLGALLGAVCCLFFGVLLTFFLCFVRLCWLKCCCVCCCVWVLLRVCVCVVCFF